MNFFIKKFVFKNKDGQADDPFAIQPGKFKNSKLKNGYRLNWSEQVFLDRAGEKERVGKNFETKVLPRVGLIMLIAFLAIIGRAAWLQIAEGNVYHDLAEGNRIRIERIEPRRGVIYDRTGMPLVRNVANFLLYFVPADLPKDDSDQSALIERVSQILGDIEPKQIVESLAKVKPGSLESYQPLFIADNIEYEKAMSLYLASANMPGIALTNGTRREYDLSSLSASHIIGYTGKISETELNKYGTEYQPIDYIGKSGIENFWENELKGISGKKQIEVDALGKEKRVITQESGEDGHNLVLSLDENLQKEIEDTLVASLKKLNLTKACVIAMDPNNGEILAMVSWPTFDSNVFARGITSEEYEQLDSQVDKPFLNRCISGEYPSGSTIKPVIAAAALEENVINENTTFLSTGGIRVGDWFFPDWKASGHGLTNVTRALAESINTFFYIVGGGYNDFTGLGVDRINKYAKLFGLGTQTGVDIMGEASGFLPTEEWKEQTKGEKWYIGDTYHLSIGQGDLLVTPLQVANYTAVFANGGSLYRPHFVRQILNSNDQVISETENAPIRSNFISQKNIDIVRAGMRQTVTSGSAQSLQSVVVPVAGKTGTAQWSTTKNNQAWFTGFAPYDKPQIVITILIEEGGEGSTVAVPIARDVLNWYFNQNSSNQ